MNKKLFLTLGLLSLSSLLLIGCDKKNNSSVEENSSKSSTIQVVTDTENPVKEDAKTTSPSTESTLDNNQTKEDIEQKYYDLIKKGYQEALDYVNSIDDPKIKQSVEAPECAAIRTATELIYEYPEDTDIINKSLHDFIYGELHPEYAK